MDAPTDWVSDSAEQFVEPVDDQPIIPRRRQLSDDEMDITPMIDMTFLLLIFFTVAGRQDQDSSVQLPPARHGAAVVVSESVIFTVASAVSDGAQVYLGDGASAERRVDTQDAGRAEEQVLRYIEEQLAADSKRKYVLIKADRQVRHREIARLTTIIAKSSKTLYVAVAEIP